MRAILSSTIYPSDELDTELKVSSYSNHIQTGTITHHMYNSTYKVMSEATEQQKT